jgi:hypothetical protein
MTLNGSAVNSDDSRLQLTTGGLQQAGSAFYNTPVNVQGFVTNFSFQLSDAKADGFTFTIQNIGPTAWGEVGGALGYGSTTNTGGIGKSVALKFDLYSNAGEGNDSTGVFTDGAYPTLPDVDMTSSGIELDSGDAISAQVSYDGLTLTLTLNDVVANKTFTHQWPLNIPQIVGGNTAYVGFTGGTGGLSASQKILTWTYGSVTPTAAQPVFSVAGGSYNSTQSVALSSPTTGAAIYYTMDGSTPTTNSNLYSSPISVNAGTITINAIATATGYVTSAVSTATYVVSSATPAPFFMPAGGSFTTPQSVMIGDSAGGVTIYYTTNGTTPTSNSAAYNGSITAPVGTTTINAIAVGSSGQSAMSSATYFVAAPVTATPVFSTMPGTYKTAQSVSITDATAGSTIYYTINGSTPTTSSTVYSKAITVASTETIKALAVAAGDQPSAVASGVFTITVTPDLINYPDGFTSTGLDLNGSAKFVTSSKALELTSSTAKETAGSAWFSTRVNVASFTTDFTFRLQNPVGDGITFTVQREGAKALGPAGAGLGYGAASPGGSGGIGKSVALKFDIYNNDGEGTDSTGFYRNGASPTIPSTNLTPTGIVLTSGHIFHEHIVYNGSVATCTLTDTVTGKSYTAAYPANLSSIVGASTAYVGFTGATGGGTVTSNILTWTFTNTVATTAKEPTLSPAPGTYARSVGVTLKPAAANSVIHYTVDGSQPTASSPVYQAPIVVLGRSLTVKAYAVTPGQGDSPVVTGTYRAK